MVWERLGTPAAQYPWQALGNIDSNDVNCRLEVEDFLQKHGHEVFIRSPTTQRCQCAQTTGAFKEFDVRCPFCNGFGFIYHDTKTRSYRRPAFGTFGFTGGLIPTSFGDFHAGDLVFYFTHDKPVVVGYHLVEVDVDDAGKATLPYLIQRIYQVKITHPFRDRTGRVEYWAVLSRELQVTK